MCVSVCVLLTCPSFLANLLFSVETCKFIIKRRHFFQLLSYRCLFLPLTLSFLVSLAVSLCVLLFQFNLAPGRAFVLRLLRSAIYAEIFV